MPPRAYNVNIIPSDELRINKFDFTKQLERLEEEYANAFTRWSNLIRKNADQEQIDDCERLVNKVCRKKHCIRNKLIKSESELMRRDVMEHRRLRTM